MHMGMFIAWLQGRGFKVVAVDASSTTFERGDVRYIARRQGGARRQKLTANRWGAEEKFKYSQRFINAEGKLDWRK